MHLQCFFSTIIFYFLNFLRIPLFTTIVQSRSFHWLLICIVLEETSILLSPPFAFFCLVVSDSVVASRLLFPVTLSLSRRGATTDLTRFC